MIVGELKNKKRKVPNSTPVAPGPSKRQDQCPTPDTKAKTDKDNKVGNKANVEDKHPKTSKGTSTFAAVTAAKKVMEMTPETLIVHGADRQNISKKEFDELVTRLSQKFYQIPRVNRSPDFCIQDVFWSKGRGFVQCTSKRSMYWTKG